MTPRAASGRPASAGLAGLGLAALGLVAMLVFTGCDDGRSENLDDDPAAQPDGQARMVAETALWQPVTAADDPFGDHRPEEVTCPGFGYGVEGEFFEMDTGQCSYATFVQPVATAPASGEELSFVFWHLALWGPDGATAHIAVQVADQLLWQQELALPVTERATEAQMTLPRDIAAGEPIYFHVHNHGSNSYRIGPVTVLPQPAITTP